MHLSIVGLNHKTATVEIREKVAFTSEQIQRSLTRLQSNPCVSESLIISTCNRTEVYCAFNEGCFDNNVLKQFVADQNGLCCDDLNPYLYELSNRDAVQHLFRVVSGLDSMVIGENQITAQAKQAYRYAVTVKSAGNILNKLFHIAFRVSKKVRTQTGIGTGSLSVSQVACDLAEKIFKRLSERTVLLIGAGENGELAAKHLSQRGVGRLFITNRTFEKAEALAEKMNAQAIPFDELERGLAMADIVVASTGAPEPVLTKSHVAPVLAKRRVPLFMIDLAIPRDIDPEVDTLDNVFLYDMDALQNIVKKSLGRRSEAVHKAKQIIAGEVDRFLEWHEGQKATPTIVEIQHYVETIRAGELEKLRDKLTPEQMEMFDQATRAMMNKVLHIPIESIRKAAKTTTDVKIIRTIRSALGLSEE